MEIALGEIWGRAASEKELGGFFQTIWQDISLDSLIPLLEGMPNRLQVIIDPNGCSTPY
jgi:hypothetical protein